MSAIEVTRQARDELRDLIETRQLPVDARERVLRTLLMLEEFPRAGKQLSRVWRDCRALIGPWGWLIVVYMYIEAEDRVVIIALHDARTSEAATAGLLPDFRGQVGAGTGSTETVNPTGLIEGRYSPSRPRIRE